MHLNLTVVSLRHSLESSIQTLWTFSTRWILLSMPRMHPMVVLGRGWTLQIVGRPYVPFCATSLTRDYFNLGIVLSRETKRETDYFIQSLKKNFVHSRSWVYASFHNYDADVDQNDHFHDAETNIICLKSLLEPNKGDKYCWVDFEFLRTISIYI